MATADMNLADYFAQFGVSTPLDANLGDLVSQAINNRQGEMNAAYAAAPMLTPTGTITRSPRGSYWIVPTAQGPRYVVPDNETFGSTQNADQSFTNQLQTTGGAWYQDAGDGVYSARSDKPGTRMQFSGSLPGLTTMTPTGYTVWDTAPSEQYFAKQKEKGFLADTLGAFMGGPGMVIGTGLGVSGLMNGGLGNWLSNLFDGASSGVSSAGNAAGGITNVSGGFTQYAPTQMLNNSTGALNLGGSAANAAGGGMNFLDSVIPYNPSNPFGNIFDYTLPPEFQFGNLSGYTTGDFTASQLPGGSLYEALGGVPGTNSAAPSWFDKILNKAADNPGSVVKTASSLLGGGSGLGALLGGLAGGLGGSSKPAGNITTVQDIPDWQKPFVISAMTGATNQLEKLGTNTPLLKPAETEIGKTIAGDYLNPSSNPYLKQTFDAAAKDVTDAYKNVVQPRTDAMFFGPGSMGGNSAYTETVARNQYGLGQNLQNLATNIYGGNYQQERNRQFGAAGTAPDFTSSYFRGGLSPWSSYGQIVGGQYGGSTSQPYFTNPYAGILGGALMGSALGRAF